MTEIEFPKSVQEVLSLIREGPLLQTKYTGAPPPLLVKNINIAMEMYLNQDAEPPNQFIGDITEDASGDIPSPPLDERIEKFRALRREINYYELMFEYFYRHKPFRASRDDIRMFANCVYEDLILCAEARLMLPNSHPYFEKMMCIYKNQGFPCGWRGGETWKHGDFIVYSRSK